MITNHERRVDDDVSDNYLDHAVCYRCNIGSIFFIAELMEVE